MPFSMDVNASFQRYGVGTPAANSYRIVDCPNPGGLPQIGNSRFSITVRGGISRVQASWLLIGVTGLPQPGQFIPARVNLLVPLSPPSLLLSVTGLTYGLPVPNTPGLVGTTIYIQTAHVDAGGLATSDAVRLSIL